jgi:hypothetical protein
VIENDTSKVVESISGISDHKFEQIKSFLQGAVYCWVKNRKDEIFALRDLVGGENTDWSSTPLEALYQKHIDLKKDSASANKVAGQDAGQVLKLVLKNDSRKFQVRSAGLSNGYIWVQ